MTPEEEFERDVKQAVNAAYERGAGTFHEVLTSCEGAPPRSVERVLRNLGAPPARPAAAVARRETSELAALFPAPDPVACQWWFTLDTIERLADLVYQAAPATQRVAFLGTPTVGFQYSRRSDGATVFDVDKHVLQALAPAGRVECVPYDVASPIPGGHAHRYAAVLADPPWYEETLKIFRVFADSCG